MKSAPNKSVTSGDSWTDEHFHISHWHIPSPTFAVSLVSQTEHIWRNVDAVPNRFQPQIVSSRAFATLGKLNTTKKEWEIRDTHWELYTCFSYRYHLQFVWTLHFVLHFNICGHYRQQVWFQAIAFLQIIMVKYGFFTNLLNVYTVI